MNNKIIRRTIRIISIILTVFIVLSFCQEYLFCLNKKPTWRAKGFYLEKEQSLDVVLMGASEIFAGYSAGLAYEKYGLTSYPWAYDDAPVSLWKSQLIEIRKKQSPQLILVEVNGALKEGDDYLYDDGAVRRYIDNIPLSMNKIQTLNNLKLKDSVISYYFPFIKYHSNLNDVPKNLKENLYLKTQGYSLLKGFQTKTKFDQDYQLYQLDKEKSLPVDEPSKDFLIDFLEYCTNNNIKVVFTRFPHRITNEKSANKYYRCNGLKKIVEKYGFDFLDFESNYSDIGIDIQNDFYDNEHLNIYGARKMTSYLGRLFVSEYGVKSHDMDLEEKNNWERSVEYTKKFFCYVERKHSEGIDESIGERSAFVKQLEKEY